MKKAISVGLVSILSTMLLVGCSATTSNPEAHAVEVEHKHLTQEKVHKLIKKAGEENGWKMTEFKSNAIIAEKIGENSESTTVTFGKDYIDITPPNSELESILEDAL